MKIVEKAERRPYGEMRTGDLFRSEASCLVCPVNTKGPMGGGIAVPFLTHFPTASTAYQRFARGGRLTPGGVFLAAPTATEGRTFKAKLSVAQIPHWIAFLATKDHWREPSRITWIEGGMAALADAMRRCARPSPTIAIPALGCGHGGLAWDEVLPVEEAGARRLRAGGARVFIYTPIER